MPLVGSVQTKLYPLPTPEELNSFFYAEVDPDLRDGLFVSLHEPSTVWIKFRREWHLLSRRYRLAVPWHFFAVFCHFGCGIQLRECYLWFLRSKPVSHHDRLMAAPLFNVSCSGRICYGRYRPWYKNKIRVYMKRLYQGFWWSEFNSQIEPTFEYIPKDWHKRRTSEARAFPLDEWAKDTAEGRDIKWVLLERPSNIAAVVRRWKETRCAIVQYMW